jgi:nitrilase
LPGSLREPAPKGENAERYYNTLPAIGPDGKLLASYRKVFLFRANLPDRSYFEGQHCEAGDTPTTFVADGVTFGLTICYDLRFPELFRALRKRGAQAIVLPASFTVPTGTAHWEILLRARAIENQVFLLAPAQTGENGDRAATYGHSLVVGPWGDKLAERPSGEGTLFADVDPARIAEAASRVDAWQSRREDLFPIE